jgi:hypothetical protein
VKSMSKHPLPRPGPGRFRIREAANESCNGRQQGRAHREVVARGEEYIRQMCDARQLANRLKVQMEALRMEHGAMQMLATRRACREGERRVSVGSL